jgi:purine-binding chemotaxis protein CheW
MNDARSNPGDDDAIKQYLTFKLAGEEYGVGILAVQEIRGWSAVTAIPHAPPWVLGVIDLRGVVVPVIDLRRRFKLEPAQFGPSTVVIVIRVTTGIADRTVGLVVDAVSEVYDLEQSAFRDLPDLGSAAASEVVNGLAHTDGKTLILLDAVRLAASASPTPSADVDGTTTH